MKSTHSLQSQHCPQFIINIFLSITICLVIAGVQPASAAPPAYHYYVDITIDSIEDPYQDCDNDVPNDCSLRGAITKANGGSASYEYYIHLTDETYALTLAGSDEDYNDTGDLDIYGGPTFIVGTGGSSTVIDAAVINDRVIDHRGNYGLTIQNVGITNGSLADGFGGGAGIRSVDGGVASSSDYLTLSNVMLTYNDVAGNDLDESGGGLYISDRPLTFSWVWVVQNTACHGGGVMISNTVSTTVSISNSAIDDNTARCGNGGGIFMLGQVSINMNHIEISRNHARNGAGYHDAGNVTLTMNDGEICTNIIDGGAMGPAGMEIYGDATITLTQICQNDAESGPGGIRLNAGSTLTMSDSRVNNNFGGDGAGILADGNTSASLQRVEISRNVADEIGGGILLYDEANMDLVNVAIILNQALYGAGMYLYNNTTANLDHVTMAENHATNTGGHAVFVGYNGHWHVNNSILSMLAYPGLLCYYDIAYGGVGSNSHNLTSAADHNECKVGGMDGLDPMLGDIGFFGPNIRTMPLLPGSPAIDAGVNSDPVSTDQYGKVRVDGNDDGTVTSDIGAFEFYKRFFMPMIYVP
jgi:hypothetical protein